MISNDFSKELFSIAKDTNSTFDEVCIIATKFIEEEFTKEEVLKLTKIKLRNKE